MERETTPTSNNSVKTGIIAVALIALLIGGTVFYIQSQNQNNITPTVNTSTAPEEDMMARGAMMGQSTYNNGTYEATGAYVSPGGPEKIGVRLTVTDGVIADAIVTPMTERATSQRYQGIFVKNFKPLVLGKRIDEIKLDKVSGSSLAPKGFNDAVLKIRQQAQT